MMRQALWILRMVVLAIAALGFTGTAFAESPREQLNQMVEQLQKSPDDNALREKIIYLAQTLKPVPAIHEEARRHFVKAVTLQKDAKKPADYDLPIQEYRQALLLAPWWSDAYFDLASAFELKQQYSDAIQNLKLSILASPEGQDARAAQDKIYALEAKAEASVKIQAEKKVSDATERNEQRIVSLQRNFIGLINQLEGAIFVGLSNMVVSGGTRTEINFLRKPFDAGGDEYKSTPYLWLQYSVRNEFIRPSVVIPTSAVTFWATSEVFPTELDSSFNERSKLDTWTLSPDGQTLSIFYQNQMEYFTKKQ